MKKRRNAALKRAIDKAWDEPSALPSATIANIYAAMLRFVRREKAKAWDECYVLCAEFKVPRKANPYRGRDKR